MINDDMTDNRFKDHSFELRLNDYLIKKKKGLHILRRFS